MLFLLASFSATGELPIDKNVKLPSAENVIDMVDAPMVAITGTQILVDGTPAGNTRAIEEANRLQRVDELFNILKNKRELWKQINPGKEFPGRRRAPGRQAGSGAGREERVPDGGVRRLPEHQLHGRPARQGRVSELLGAGPSSRSALGAA